MLFGPGETVGPFKLTLLLQNLQKTQPFTPDHLSQESEHLNSHKNLHTKPGDSQMSFSRCSILWNIAQP